MALVLVDEELQNLEHPGDAHDEEQLEAHDEPGKVQMSVSNYNWSKRPRHRSQISDHITVHTMQLYAFVQMYIFDLTA